MQEWVKENLLDARKSKTSHHTYFAFHLNWHATSQSILPPFQLILQLKIQTRFSVCPQKNSKSPQFAFFIWRLLIGKVNQKGILEVQLSPETQKLCRGSTCQRFYKAFSPWSTNSLKFPDLEQQLAQRILAWLLSHRAMFLERQKTETQSTLVTGTEKAWFKRQFTV